MTMRRGRRRRRKKMNIKEKKNMKLQPYLDFWVSETEMDFSCPACVLLWCLSVPLCPPPPSLSFFLLPKQPKTGSDPFVPSFLPLSSQNWPSVSLCHVFHILECQCATCWHCAWMITCLYIVIENRIPFPWCWQKMVWMLYRFRFSVHLWFCSVTFFFLNVRRA